MTDPLIVRARMKELTQGMSVSADFADELDIKVKELIEQAMKRAKKNNRNTVMARDI